MDIVVAEQHKDKLQELTSLVRQMKKQLGAMQAQSSQVISSLGKIESRNDLRREIR